MKSKILSLILILFVLSLNTSSALAVEASPSGTIADKINALKSEIASKAAILKQQMSKKLQNKAISGKISNIDDTRITISSINGDKTILVNEYTKITNSVVAPKAKGKSITSPPVAVKDLTSGDFISALGDLDDKNNMVAKRIIKGQEPKWTKSAFLWGQITGNKNPRIDLKSKEGNTSNIITSGKTDFWLGSEESSMLDAKVGKFLVARGNPAEGVFPADFIYFLPQAGFIKPEKKVASGSGEASASAKP